MVVHRASSNERLFQFGRSKSKDRWPNVGRSRIVVFKFCCSSSKRAHLIDSTVESLIKTKCTHADIHKNEVFASSTYDKPDGKKGQLVAVARHDIRVGARFSFLRVTDRESYKSYDQGTIPYRSEELVDYLECYRVLLERIEEEAQKLPEGSRSLTEEQFRDLAISVAHKHRRRSKLSWPPDDIPGGVALSRVRT